MKFRSLFWSCAAGTVVGAALYIIPDGDIRNPSLFGDAWDGFTTADSEFPAVETSTVKRQAYCSVLRNPLNTVAQQYKTTSIVDESRVPVPMCDPAYDSVGQLESDFQYRNEKTGQLEGKIESFRCTFTLSDVQGYQVENGESIVIGAGHCLNHTDKKTGKNYELVGAEFVTDYIDTNGQLQTFKSELNHMKWRDDNTLDFAIASLKKKAPNGMQLARAIPDYVYSSGQLVSAPGFSGDKTGQHIDIGCAVVSLDGHWIYDLCDISKGASGSPLEISRTETSITYGAVLASHYPGTSNLTRHNQIPSWFLDQVPFLQNNSEAQEVLASSMLVTCLKVTEPIGLTIRVGAGSHFNRATNNAVPYDGVVYEIGRIGAWSKIEMQGGSDAWIKSTGNTHRYGCRR